MRDRPLGARASALPPIEDGGGRRQSAVGTAARISAAHTYESDASLVARARTGSKESFAAIVLRYEARVYCFARRLVCSHHDAEDITQETFLAAYGGIGAFRGESSLLSWLCQIARNAALMRKRTDARRAACLLGVDASSSARSSETNADRALELRRRAAIVLEALGRLDEAQRMAFLLCDVEGRTSAEAARMLRASVPAVRQRAYRARRLLRRSLHAAERFQAVRPPSRVTPPGVATKT